MESRSEQSLDEVSIIPGAALRPIQIHVMVICEVGAQGNPQESALRCKINRQIVDRARAEIELCGCLDAVDHVVHLAGGFLQHKEVVLPQESHARRLSQVADNRSDPQVRVKDDWAENHPVFKTLY